MKLGIACDHRGYEIKENLKKVLNDFEIIDYGCYSKEMVDYPDYCFKLCDALINKQIDLGIVMCGTGIGVSIACNKVKGIRCAKINNEKEAKSAKEHNNANILAFGAEFNTEEEIKKMIEIFINSTFNSDLRYKIRIDKVKKYEETNEY